MSKIGRIPIPLNGVTVSVEGKKVLYDGKNAKGEHVVHDCLDAVLEGDLLRVVVCDQISGVNCLWGLHRALLANKIGGAHTKFEKKIKIVGLGYKAIYTSGVKVEFTLGYSHKVYFNLPEGVEFETDKTGQNLTLRSADKELLGLVCSKICALRPVEPYKGTGVYLADSIVRRKAGKAKSA